MVTKTGVGIVPKILAGAVILVVAAFLYPKITSDTTKDEQRPTLLEVSFKPEKRAGLILPGRMFSDKVTIELTIGGTIIPNEGAINSPWTATVPPGRGRKITLKATQVYGTSLACKIQQPGYPAVLDSAVGPSGVSCTYTTK